LSRRSQSPRSEALQPPSARWRRSRSAIEVAALVGREQRGIGARGPEGDDFVEQWLCGVVAGEVAQEQGEVRSDGGVVAIVIGGVGDGEGEERGPVVLRFGRLPRGVVEVLPDPCAGVRAGGGLKGPGIVEGEACGGAEVALALVVAGEDDGVKDGLGVAGFDLFALAVFLVVVEGQNWLPIGSRGERAFRRCRSWRARRRMRVLRRDPDGGRDGRGRTWPGCGRRCSRFRGPSGCGPRPATKPGGSRGSGRRPGGPRLRERERGLVGGVDGGGGGHEERWRGRRRGLRWREAGRERFQGSWAASGWVDRANRGRRSAQRAVLGQDTAVRGCRVEGFCWRRRANLAQFVESHPSERVPEFH
jgi:hypothetical protein